MTDPKPIVLPGLLRRPTRLTGLMTGAMSVPFLALLPYFSVTQPAFAQSRASVGKSDTVAEVRLDHPWAVQVELFQTPVDLQRLPPIDEFRRYRVYTVPHEVGGKTVYRLRIGFFATREAAEAVANALIPTYPSAWITRVSEAERRIALESGRGANVVAESVAKPADPPLPRAAAPAVAPAPATPPVSQPEAPPRAATNIPQRAPAPPPASAAAPTLAPPPATPPVSQPEAPLAAPRTLEVARPAAVAAAPVAAAPPTGAAAAQATGVPAVRREVVRVPAASVPLAPAPAATPEPPAKNTALQSPETQVAQGAAGRERFVVQLTDPWVVQIDLAREPVELRDLPDLPEFRRYRVYAIPHEVGGRVAYRLRVGFFPTEEAAATVARSLKQYYPNTWITKVPEIERLRAARDGAGALVAGAPGMPSSPPVASRPPAPSTPAPVVAEPARPTVPPQAAAPPAPAPPTTQTPDTRPTAQTVPPPSVTRVPIPPAPAQTQPAPTPRTATTPPAPRPPAPPARAASPQEVARATEMMDEAQSAMANGQFPRAVLLYSEIARIGGPEQSKQAQEYLGLARERNGQDAQARAEYEEYLSRYPDGEDTQRVRQRLMGLLTARAEPRDSRRERQTRVRETQYNFNGSFSQFYERHVTNTQLDGSQVDQSTFDNFMDLLGRMRDERFDGSFRAAGSYTFNFLNRGDSEIQRLSTLYVDGNATELGLFARVGRQTRSSGGVLGRFDGGHVRYAVTPDIKVNVVGGLPVRRTRDLYFNEDSYFYGTSLDLGTFDGWDTTLFFIDQTTNGLTDRRGTGTEIRYFDANLSGFGVVDYDIYYSELNLATLSSSYVFENRATTSFTVDYRRSPILSINDALIGQSVSRVSDLVAAFTPEELRQIALDRTAISKSATLSATYPLDERYQIGADYTISHLTGTTASAGVEGLPGTDIEHFYSVQFIGNSIVKDGDIGIIALRYADTTNFDRYTAQFDTRYPVIDDLRVGPRLRLDYRDNKADSGVVYAAIPSLRLNYFLTREIQFEFEGGVEWSRSDPAVGESETTTGYFIFVGHRIDF
jgi:SPOR domain